MLRFAEIDDLPAIVSIYNQTIAGRIVTADTEEITVESRVNWFHGHNKNTRPLWVWKENDKVLAWASLKDFYGRPAYNQTAEISIYVDEKSRGKGIGAYFLDHAIKQAPQLEIKNLLGFIFGHNEPSIKLFYKFGFEDWGHLPGVALLDDEWCDLLILGKKV